MIEKHFILATAGHVDHGKSALVKALTGTDPDRLPEEKARGITIELGFAELNLTGPNGERFHAGIIDVPGHEDFVRSMIAGVGSVDVALLVIAADDGWMPQTEEHLQILSYLGVRRAVVAATKSDSTRADPGEIRNRLRGTPFADASIVATSVRTGNGIEELRRALGAEFAQLSSQRDIGKPRVFIDRAFALHGIGAIVTGTLTGGRLSQGQTLVIQPNNLTSRIRSIQNHSREIADARPGTRTALNLSDIKVGPSPNMVGRGGVVTIPDLGSLNQHLEVMIERSPRLDRDSRPIKNHGSVYVHHGTSRVAAKIVFVDQELLRPGERALAQLRLVSPILAFVGDRFVLRDSSQQLTIGGGVVLNIGDGELTNAHREFLRRRAAALDEAEVYVESEVNWRGFLRQNDLLRQSNFSDDDIASAIAQLRSRDAIVVRGKIVADPSVWRGFIQKAIELIDQFHASHPEQRGIELADFRRELGVESNDVFDVLLADLGEVGLSREKSMVGRKTHRASLPAEIQSVADRIRAQLTTNPFDPPSRREIAPDRAQQSALRFLIEQGEFFELGPEIILQRESAEQMQQVVTEFISRHRSATASQLRQALGTSRRVAIPFLEYLDRIGVTQRVGDSRRLRKKKSTAVAPR
jgi:selenocysteine-specific elongation factor